MDTAVGCAEPRLRMRGIDKSFPGVLALRDAHLELRPGEVLALVGENGAGKSTLIKTLGGAHVADAGTIEVDGREVAIRDPIDAQAAGIAVIYQELDLVPALSARENIFLGREHTTLGFVHRRDERRRAHELLERISVGVDPDTPCSRLTVAQQQVVEIAKALSRDVRIVVMDEPSAALTPREVESLFGIVRDLQANGIGVIYVSHRLDEVFAIADRITVLRDGAVVADGVLAAEVSRAWLIERMVGRQIDDEFPARNVTIGEPRLVVSGLTRADAVRDVSFVVRRGEVLALTGLVGAGRTETARLIFGADRRDSGSIELDGRSLSIRGPRDAIRAGICMLTEDRKNQGLVLGRSVLENFGLPSLRQLSAAGFVQPRREHDAFARFAELLRIQLRDAAQPARDLSGGNQQKVLLARWLQASSEVVVFDEPTRGIDVGGKYEIYSLINELAAAGKAIVMISSELPEVLGMADRILVLHEGRITGEIEDVANATQQHIMELAVR